jgi:hypothetical protein
VADTVCPEVAEPRPADDIPEALRRVLGEPDATGPRPQFRPGAIPPSDTPADDIPEAVWIAYCQPIGLDDGRQNHLTLDERERIAAALRADREDRRVVVSMGEIYKALDLDDSCDKSYEASRVREMLRSKGVTVTEEGP